MWTVRSLLHAIADYIFPPRCFVCRNEGDSLCPRCVRALARAVDQPNNYTWSMFDFKDRNVRNIIHAIKYYRRRDLIRPLAGYMAQEYLRMSDRVPEPVLCPIPMPRWRSSVRGYNQAELLANELAHATGLQTTSFLKRSKATVRQARRHRRTERLNAQKGSFAVAVDPRGAHILLVDDVITTGATLAEARKTLLAHGASSVHAVTLAH